MDNFVGGPIARIAPEDSTPFYALLMSRCVAWRCIGFEIDFLDFYYVSTLTYHTPLVGEHTSS